MSLSWWAATDVGKVRTLNEDTYYADGRLFAVADGLGGHLAGEIASKIAVLELAKSLSSPSADRREALRRAFNSANTAVIGRARERSEQSGMGTTLTVALAEQDTAYFAHVGDSRAYLFRDNKLTQLTKDDSLVSELVARGELTRAEADVHPQRNIITKAIGSEPTLVPQLYSMTLNEGDRLLLCTDGLCGLVDDDSIANILQIADARECAKTLIDKANEAGGSDNITVVIIDKPDDGAVPGSGRVARAAITLVLILMTFFVTYRAGSWWLNQNFFLSSRNGKVVLYRGLPIDLGRLALYRVEQQTKVPTSRLPAYYRKRLAKGIVVGSIRQARRTIGDIRALADREAD